MSPDRVGLPTPLLVAVVALSGCSLGLAASAVPSPSRSATTLFLMGAVSAVLGVAALRSLSIQRVVRAQVTVAAVLATQLAVMSGGRVGPWTVAWMAVSVAALVLGTHIEHRRRPSVDGSPLGRRWWLSGGAAVAVVLALAVLVGPRLSSNVETGVSLGSLAGAPAQPLSRTDEIDMSSRPDLGDEVLFTVRADRAAFWRTATFDIWDGRGWQRDQNVLYSLDAGGRVRHTNDDLGVTTGARLVQEFRIEGDGAIALPAAATVVDVGAAQPVGQYFDGTLASAAPMGRGAAYRVTSRVSVATADQLREVDGDRLPLLVERTWARPAVTTDRVRELARRIAAENDGAYDRVQAVERWLGANTRYSLDAPLTPAGRDVVDHFLFDSRIGWCEQVSSAMVVLLREMGVPARVAAGFVPGDRDASSDRFVVRARDAHSWAEVWFPRYGWVPFDPTAGVPGAGDEPAVDHTGTWVDATAAGILGSGALVLVGRAGRRWWRGRPRERSGTRTSRSLGGRAEELERRLEAVGTAVGTPRSPWETATTFGARVDEAGAATGAASAGRLLDELRYAPGVADADERVERALVDLSG